MAALESNASSELPIKSAIAVAVSMAVGGYAEPAQAQDDDARKGGIEEITVTARKREENLQDVAASIQAITGESIKKQNILNLADAIKVMPSVSYVGGTAGANKIIFRGVSDNPVAFIAASSAALYIDEQPLTQFSINPEPRMVDIERIEAMAGPQGTLYGDSSQSGTLRIVTNKPDPSGFFANVSGMLRGGEDSSASNEFSGVLNMPLVEDVFAIRLVGFTARDGGFVDIVNGVSPMRGTRRNTDVVGEDVNYVDTAGGRIAAKWFMNEDWALTGMYIGQTFEAGGRNDYDPTVGDLKTVKFYRDTRDDEWSQAALTLDGKIGGMEFVSVTSYFDRDINYVFDRTTYSAYFNYNFCPQYATYCWSGRTGAENWVDNDYTLTVVPGAGIDFYSLLPNDQDTIGYNTLDQHNERFTQEFRLTATGDNYRMVLGAFYEEKSEYWEYYAYTPEFESSLAYYYWTSFYDASGGPPAWWLSVDDTDWEQWAVYGNFSFDFSDKFTTELGLRYFDQTMDRTYYVDKPFLSAPGVWPDVTTPTGGNDGWVPKLTFRYNISDDKMLYALYSEGFRAGGGNRNRVPENLTVLPLAYEPDKLKNFEIGAKTLWADGKILLNATLFFGQWEDYQIETLDPSFQPCTGSQSPATDPCGQPFQIMVANVGDAEQTGLELAVQAAPTENLNLGLDLTWVDAKTSEEFIVNTPVEKGTQLPNVPELKYHVWGEYLWPQGSGADVYMRASYAWTDKTRNQLEYFEFQPGFSGAATFIQPSYGVADLRAGIRGGDGWMFEVFIDNLTDERAVIFDDPYFFDTFFEKRRVTTIRPRELGVRFSYSWQ